MPSIKKVHLMKQSYYNIDRLSSYSLYDFQKKRSFYLPIKSFMLFSIQIITFFYLWSCFNASCSIMTSAKLVWYAYLKHVVFKEAFFLLIYTQLFLELNACLFDILIRMEHHFSYYVRSFLVVVNSKNYSNVYFLIW